MGIENAYAIRTDDTDVIAPGDLHQLFLQLFPYLARFFKTSCSYNSCMDPALAAARELVHVRPPAAVRPTDLEIPGVHDQALAAALEVLPHELGEGMLRLGPDRQRRPATDGDDGTQADVIVPALAALRVRPEGAGALAVEWRSGQPTPLVT